MPNSIPDLAGIEPQVKASIPVFKWSDAVDRGDELTATKDGVEGVDKLRVPIKFMLNFASQMIMNQHADPTKITELLHDESKLETLVVIDTHLTPTARMADYMLPDAMSLEQDSSLPDEDQFAAQGMLRFRSTDSFTVPLTEFREDPEANPLETASGKIEIYSETLAQMAQDWEFPQAAEGERITALPEYVQTWEGVEEARSSATYPLQATSHHTKARTHSSYWNVDWLKEAHHQRVWMNPADAGARDIISDDQIFITGKRGTIKTAVYVTPRIAPGVISIPEGGWYTPNEDGVDEGGCSSTLASLRTTPIAKGNAQMTMIVDVEKA